MPLSGDTVYFYRDFYLNNQYYSPTFRFSSSDQKIRNIQFQIDSKNITTFTTGDTGVYGCYLYSLSNGVHNLISNIYTESGTGSIADKVGGEGYKFTREWTIIVNNDSIPPIKTSIINGFLKLSWPKYPTNNFSKFIFDKYYPWVYRYLSKPEFVDSAYVGEGGGYSISVMYNNNQWDYYTNNTIPSEIPKIKLDTVLGKNIITWNKCKYYSAVDTFELFLGDISEKNFIKITQDPNDTTAIYSTIPIGQSHVVTLIIIPKLNKNVFRSNMGYFASHPIDLP